MDGKQAFRKIKEMSKTPTLKFYDPKKKTRISADAVEL